MLTRSLMYCGERSFTILCTSQAISLSLLTWSGWVFVSLSNSLRDDVKSLLMNLNALSRTLSSLLVLVTLQNAMLEDSN